MHVSVCFLDKLHHDPKVQIGGNSVKTNRIVSDLHYSRGESALLTLDTERVILSPLQMNLCPFLCL